MVVKIITFLALNAYDSFNLAGEYVNYSNIEEIKVSKAF